MQKHLNKKIAVFLALAGMVGLLEAKPVDLDTAQQAVLTWAKAHGAKGINKEKTFENNFGKKFEKKFEKKIEKHLEKNLKNHLKKT